MSYKDRVHEEFANRLIFHVESTYFERDLDFERDRDFVRDLLGDLDLDLDLDLDRDLDLASRSLTIFIRRPCNS